VFTLQRRMIEWLGNYELKKIWKEARTIPAFSWRDWGKPRNSSVGIARFPAKIRTENLSNTSLGRQRCTDLLGRSEDDNNNNEVVLVRKHNAWRRAESLGIKLPALTSVLNGREWTASCVYQITPNEKDSSRPTHFRGGLIDFVESLQIETEKRKIPDPVGNQTTVVHLIACYFRMKVTIILPVPYVTPSRSLRAQNTMTFSIHVGEALC
jgi:hypothetical protein